MHTALCIMTMEWHLIKSQSGVKCLFHWNSFVIIIHNAPSIHFFPSLSKLWQMSMNIMQLKLHKIKTWMKAILTCLTKFDCCTLYSDFTVTSDRTWLTKEWHECKIIMLSFPWYQFVFSFSDFERFGIESGFPFSFFLLALYSALSFELLEHYDWLIRKQNVEHWILNCNC